MAVRVRVGRVALMGLLVGGTVALFMAMNARAGVERTWDGGGTTGNWSEAANWAGDEVPQATDTLIFPAGLDASERATTADLPANFAELRFADTGYAVAGSTTIDPDRIAVSVAGAAVVIDAPVDVTGGLTVDLGVGGATVTLGGTLSGNGDTTVLGTGELLLSGDGDALGFASVPGTSTATLRVTGSYPQLSIDLRGGEAVIDGAVFELQADDNAIRTSGTGTIANRLSVDAGVLDPGVAHAVDAATLPVGGLDFHVPATYAPDLLADGTSDVLVNHRAIFLNDSPLAIDGPAGADTYTIIDNRDTHAVSGTFEDTPEGGFVSADGGALQYAISYQGGDGNDVVLTKVAESVWDGGGADNNWSTPTNWVGDSAPSVADSIEFPAGATKLTTNNDLIGFRGGIVVTGQGYTFGGNDITPAGGLLVSGGSATVNLTVHGEGSVTATNNASLTLTADNDYTGDTNVLEDSTLEIGGDQPSSHVIVDFSVLTVNGTTGWVEAAFSSYVFGTGTIDGELVVQHSGSRVSPGTGEGTIGILTVAALDLSDGSVMEFDGDGADVDRLVVTSTFGSLGDAPLRLAGTVTASPITLIDVIDGTGSLDGTFAGLPDDSSVTFGGAPYTISYDSGTDGNDVVLTAAAASTATWDGGGTTDNWSDAANWVGDAVPANGSTLTFKEGAARETTNNDLTDFTGSIRLTGGTYVMTGNTFTLDESGLIATKPDPNVPGHIHEIRMPMTGTGGVTANQTPGLKLIADNTYTGETLVELSTLAIAGQQPSSPVTTRNGATLLILGTTGSVSVSDGPSSSSYLQGTGTVQGNLTFTGPENRLQYDFGSGDHLTVNGTIDFGTGSLLSGSGTPTDEVLTILANDSDDPIIGLLSEYTEGQVIDIGGAEYTISYKGGDGNDITLTRGLTRVTWDGGSATSDNWSDAANWVGDVLPPDGAVLVFDDSVAARLTTNNDLANMHGGMEVVGSFSITGLGFVIDEPGVKTNGNVVLSLPLAGAGGVSVDGFTLTLNADNTYTGRTTVGLGTLIVNGDQPSSTVVLDQSILELHGVAGPVEANAGEQGGSEVVGGGVIDGDLRFGGTGNALNVDLSKGYAVNGQVLLGIDTELLLTGVIQGDSVVLVDNDGAEAVSGDFEGYPEGTSVLIDEIEYRLTYNGGDGNDIELAVPPPGQVWTGAGADDKWSTTANWASGRAPADGDRVVFPDGAAQFTNTNDIDGLEIAIEVTGSGYTFSGNRVTLTSDGLRISSGTTTLSIELDGEDAPATIESATTIFAHTDNDFSGMTSCQGSELTVVGSQTQSPVVLDDCTLIVDGDTGSVIASKGAIIRGGGTIHGSLTWGDGGGTFQPNIALDPIPTLTVTEGVSVTGAAFDPQGTPSADVIMVLANGDTDPVSGTFNGLAEGATVVKDGVSYTVSYAGGDGNDIVLAKVVVDPTLPELSISDGSPSSVTEGDVGDSPVTVTFNVTRSGDTSGTSSASVSAGTDDFTVLPAVVEFAAEETSKTITATVVTDNVDEADEDMVVSLASPVGATISDGTGVATLIDDDTAGMSVTAPASPVAEGADAVFTVSIDGARDHSVVVSVATGAAGDTAAEGSDYPSLDGGSLTFLPSDTAKTVTVATTDDNTDESSETVSVVVDGTIVATATIADNDEPPPPPPVVPSASIGDVSVEEGDGTAVFTVTLSGPTTAAVTVGYATADGSARAGDDYTVTSGTLSFTPGTTTQTVAVPVAGDTVDEAAESFEVRLGSPVGATLADGAGVASIVDDDASPKPMFPSATSTVNEAVGMATFTVTLPRASEQDLRFGWGTTAGTAMAGSDFTDSSGSLTIPAGSTTGSFTVPITSDIEDEPDESFTLSVVAPTPLQPAGGRSVAVPNAVPDGEVLATAVVTIVDDDAAQQPPPSDPPASNPPASNPPATESTPSATPRPTTSGTPVARTGFNTVTSTALALVLIAGGATLMAWRRRAL